VVRFCLGCSQDGDPVEVENIYEERRDGECWGAGSKTPRPGIFFKEHGLILRLGLIIITLIMNRSATCLACDELSLSALSLRHKASITGFDLPPDQRARLLEMGLTTGTQVQIIRFAPLGDPMEIEVRGYRLSLRKREAEGIRVARV